MESMSEQPLGTSDEKPSAPQPHAEKRFRRTMLSTGFSTVPGKTCQVCGFEGFRWQTTCPEGHPLA